MTKRSTTPLEFASCKRRKVKADFGGGEITSDAGVMLQSEIDKKLKLTQRIAGRLNDQKYRCHVLISD